MALVVSVVTFGELFELSEFGADVDLRAVEEDREDGLGGACVGDLLLGDCK